MPTRSRPFPFGLSRVGGFVLVGHGLLVVVLCVGLSAPGAAEGGRKPVPVHRLDVNAAEAESLQLLPGVGPSLARRMIDRRQQRPFADLADLRRVRGIGEELSARMAAHVRYGPGRGG
ncbi:MAG: helix-hairpin-helix domain-containing protein [Phycisphaerae bacterium]|nr:helix-hairpin-helix domain-containing protein [Phycisphaerae bacterium]